jgi:hypothetical protein
MSSPATIDATRELTAAKGGGDDNIARLRCWQRLDIKVSAVHADATKEETIKSNNTPLT